MKKTLIISCVLMLALSANLHGQCTWTTTGAGAWTDAIWTKTGVGCGAATTPPTTLTAGMIVNINHATITHNNRITFQSGSTLNLNSGSYLHITSGGLNINSGAVLNVTHAAVKLDGENTGIFNQGTINITACLVLYDGEFLNTGTVNEAAAGAGFWTKDGDIENFGTWTGVDWCEEGGTSGSEQPTSPAQDCNTV